VEPDDLDNAIARFIEKEVSLARAAYLAGVSLGEMIDILRSRGIPWVEYTEEAMRMDDEAISRMLEREYDRSHQPVAADSPLSASHSLLGLRDEIFSLCQQHGADNVRYYIRQLDDRTETCFVVDFEQPNLLRRIGLQQALSDLLQEPVYVFTPESLRDEVRHFVLERCQQL